MFKKIRRYAHDPYYALGYDMIEKCPKLMTDKFYIKTLWRMIMGYELNLKNPQTFNEKLQWLKLYDHNPLYPTLVDKYRVKQYVTDKIGAEHVIPTLAVYHSVEEIDLDKLPNQFVLKCNHDSGSVVICRDKTSFDLDAAKKKLDAALKHNFYWDAREWAYKHVKPVIFAEQYMEDSSIHDLPDYKFFAFDGVVKALFIATERSNTEAETKFDFFDLNFNHIDVTNGHPNAEKLPEKPICFQEMISFSEKLSKGFPEVRCDFYEVNGKSYFGEFTFYHWGGMTPFNPSDFDKELGGWIRLPNTDGGGFAKDNAIIYIHEVEREQPKDLLTYKFFCFNGEPCLCYVTVKNDEIWENYYDMDFKPLDIHRKYPLSSKPLVKPKSFEKMILLAKELSKGLPHVRMDLFDVNGDVYFSEYTFYDWGGLFPFASDMENQLGGLIQLKRKS